jgi:subtilisin family serine protease
MQRSVHLSCLLALSLAGLPAFAAGPDAAAGRFIERAGVLEFSGQLILKPKAQPGVDVDDMIAQLGGAVVERIAATGEIVISVPAAPERGESENAVSAALMASGGFDYAEPNWICYPVGTPNDPQFGNQWHHSRMGTSLAWDRTTGGPTITVAVVDTGIDTSHPDLAPIRIAGYNAATRQREVDGGAVNDINGHGTHVAGCAAAIGNNGVGVVGMGWNFRLMMVRATNASGGGASMTDLLDGARWAADNGAKTVSCSYSGVSTAAIETTGAVMRANGSLLLWAGGNDGTQINNDHPSVIVVGASDQGDNRAGFSNYGNIIDVFAPGVDILATFNGGGYGYLSGTSMATPIANGLCALIWSVDPSLTPNQIEYFLTRGSVDLGAPGDDAVFGWGRINPLASLSLAADSASPTAPVASPDSAEVVQGRSVTVDVLANDTDLNGDALSIVAFDSTTARGGSIALSNAGGRDQLVYTAPLTGTTDTFSYTVSDPGGLTSSTTVTVSLVDTSAYRVGENPASTLPTLNVSFYALAGPSSMPNFGAMRPYARNRTALINAASTNGNFMTSGRADNVGALFTGYIRIPADSMYTFFTNSDDGSKLWIGDTLVVNNDGLHGMQERSGEIGLRAGTHAFKVEFFENGGGAGLIVSFQSAELSKRVIPSTILRRPCAADFNADGFVDFFDFDDFVACFDGSQCPLGQNDDFNTDGFADFFDFDDFVTAFGAGC